MAETKSHYRIPPCAEHDIPAMESWLEDMAAKGLYISKDGFFWGIATFDEGLPRRIRFRLEPTATNGGLFSEEYAPEDGALQMLHQMGWTYRARRGQFHIYSAADPHAPELHTDPQVQAMTLDSLTKFLRKNLYGTFSLILLYGLGIYGDILLSAAVTIGTWHVSLLLGLLLWMLLGRIKTVLTLSAWCAQLKKGDPLPHRSDYTRRGKIHILGKLLRLVLWVGLILAIALRVLPMETKVDYISLDDYHEPFPFSTVADIYPDAQITRDDWMLKSQVYTWSDPLAPENYDFTELAEVTADGKTFTCYLSLDYHRTSWDFVAAGLAREFVSQCGGSWMDRTLGPIFGDELAGITPLEDTGWDYAVAVRKQLPEPWLILQKGSIVIRVRYAPIGEGPDISPEKLAELLLLQIR